FFVLPAFSKRKPRDDEPAEKPPEGAGDGRQPGRSSSQGPATTGTLQGPARSGTLQGPARASTSQPAQGAPRTGQAPSRGGGSRTAGSVEEALDEIRARVR